MPHTDPDLDFSDGEATVVASSRSRTPEAEPVPQWSYPDGLTPQDFDYGFRQLFSRPASDDEEIPSEPAQAELAAQAAARIPTSTPGRRSREESASSRPESPGPPRQRPRLG